MTNRAAGIAPEAPVPTPAPRRVLVVEDDAGLNRLAQRVLRRAGFEAHGVLAGADAIERLSAGSDSALLLDQQLPDMAGTELLRRLADQGQRIPFVAMTGHGDEKTAVEMMKLGARDYLVKGTGLADRLPKVFHRVFRELETEGRLVRAEKALRTSESRLRTIFASTSDFVFLKDRERRYIMANAAMERLFGRPSGELTGSRDEDLFDVEAARHIEVDDKRVLAGETVEEEAEMTVEGQRRTFHVKKTPVRDLEGRVVGLCGIARDVTERIELRREKALIEQQYHQTQKLESVGRLAGGVAHDLNNLLSPILGYGEMLLADAAGADPRKEQLDQIVQAAMRARDLVRQLLAFSRKQTLDFKALDLNALITNFGKLLRRTIREDVAIELKLAEPLAPIRGDMGQLEQVVMNLAVNAQDAMPDGGVLTIETAGLKRGPDDPAGHRGVPPGAYATIVVHDTGCGMDAETRRHLFEPFFTTKGKDEGTGLGLATVYGIVKQHGGYIFASSKPGKGARFTVYLPADRQLPLAEAEAEALAPAVPGGSETVLLVEDNEQVRDLVRVMLARQGYTVLVAGGGKEALALADRHEGPLHLVLTDVVMPGMNGKAVYEQVRRRHGGARVLYMSGYSKDVIAQRGMKDSGIGYIQKPFSAGTLAAKVRAVIDR